MGQCCEARLTTWTLNTWARREGFCPGFVAVKDMPCCAISGTLSLATIGILPLALHKTWSTLIVGRATTAPRNV